MPFFNRPHHIPGADRRTADTLPRLEEIDHRHWRLFVDSRCVQPDNVLDPFHWIVNLWDDLPRNRFENVEMVCLKMYSIPKVDGEDYVCLDIAELRDANVDSNCPVADKAFSICYFDNSLLAPGDVKPMDKCWQQCVTFDPPIPALSKLTVKVVKYDGMPVQLDETGGVDRVSFVLDVFMKPAQQGG